MDYKRIAMYTLAGVAAWYGWTWYKAKNARKA